MDDRNTPASKGDLQDLEERINRRMDRRFDDLTEMIRDTETKLLQAFYGFAESNQKRVGQVEAANAILVSRMSTLESRLMEVEKRLNIPPQAMQ